MVVVFLVSNSGSRLLVYVVVFGGWRDVVGGGDKWYVVGVMVVGRIVDGGCLLLALCVVW